jgi:predicted phosphodiesterase
VAPVVAVRGNVDRGSLARLPVSEMVEVDGRAIYVVHDVSALDLDPAAAGVAAVISGHSHRASIRWEGGILFLNPGAAGPRRFGLALSVARLTITETRLEPEILALEPWGPRLAT